MAAVLSAVLGGAMNIFDMASTFFPTQADGVSKINIAVALDNKNGGTIDAGGDVPSIYMYDNFGEPVGKQVNKKEKNKIKSGNVREISITHKDGNIQPVYTLFVGKDDAICIAYASITFPTNEKYFFDGSFGQACGGAWYYSGIYVQESNYRPKCMWIGSAGHENQKGFQVRWPTFADKELKDVVSDVVCDTVDFRIHREDPKYISVQMYPNNDTMEVVDVDFKGDRTNARPEMTALQKAEEKGKSGGGGEQIEQDMDIDEEGKDETMAEPQELPQPSMGAQQPSEPPTYPNENSWMSDSIVMSNTGSAIDLCNSDNSAGPDFVNPKEGLFCQMTDGKKQVYPVCPSSTVASSGTVPNTYGATYSDSAAPGTADGAGFPTENGGVVGSDGGGANNNPGNVVYQNGGMPIPSEANGQNLPPTGGTYGEAPNEGVTNNGGGVTYGNGEVPNVYGNSVNQVPAQGSGGTTYQGYGDTGTNAGYSGGFNVMNSETVVNRRRATETQNYQCFDLDTLTLRGAFDNPSVAKRATSKYKTTIDWTEGENIKRYI